MTTGRRPGDADRVLGEVLDAEGRTRAPDRLLEEVFTRTEGARQVRARPWDRWRLPRFGGPVAPLAVAAILVLALSSLLVVSGGAPPAPRTPSTPAPSEEALATPPAAPVAAACNGGSGFTVAAGAAWVACPSGLRRIDTGASAPAVGDVAEGLGLPVELDGQLWAPAAGGISRVDPSTGAVLRHVDAPAVSALAAGDGVLWAATQDGRLLRIDPATGKTAAAEASLAGPLAVLVAGGSPWVTSSDGTVRRFDPVTMGVLATVRVGSDAGFMAADDTSLYVVSQGVEGSVTRIDLATNAPTSAVVAEPTDPRSLGAIAVDDAGLYVARRSGLLTLDPVTLAIRDVRGLPGYPIGFALDGSTLWSLSDTGRLDRIAVR